MDEQAYGDWHTCVNEHIVRLGEIRIALTMNDNLTAEKLRTEYLGNRKFIYLPNLEDKIIGYEKQREEYPSLADFFPELISAFSEIDTNKIRL